jgi:hypothetical protein
MTSVGKSRTTNSKVGSSSVSTVNFTSWAKTSAVTPAPKTKRVRTKEVVHQIFVECAKVINDPFWIEKFNSASVGKLPTNFYFNNDILTYKKGAKCDTLALSHNPIEAAEKCMEFFRKHKGMFSPLDQQLALDKKNDRIQSMTNADALTWENANKKTKECLISYFITDQIAVMKLTNEQGEQLRRVINNGLFVKLFDKNNITIMDNRIFSIGGLLWDPHTQIFFIDQSLTPSITRSYQKKKTTTALSKDNVPQFGAKWDKYINKYVANSEKQHNLYMNASAGLQTPSPTEEEDDDDDDDDDEDD